MTSADVRNRLVDALRLDLIGPEPGSALEREELPYNPSRWYLTGFLVPMEGDREDPGADEGMEEGGEEDGDEGSAPDVPAARRKFLPSSVGLSLFVGPSTRSLRITARWGDYVPFDEQAPVEEAFRLHAPDDLPPDDARPHVRDRPCRRTPREETKVVELPQSTAQPIRKDLDEPTGAGPMQIAVSVRPVPCDGKAEGLVPPGTRCVSVFLVNRRFPLEGEERARAYAFQAELEVRAEEPLVARVNTQGLHSKDWDESLADLQYRDVVERAVGHGISSRLICDPDGECRAVATSWIPEAAVARVEPTRITGVELGMEALAGLADGASARAALGGLATQYAAWIEARAAELPAGLHPKRKEVAHDLFTRARVAARRIAEGVDLLAGDEAALEAFRIANRAMAAAARQRRGVQEKARPEALSPPAWRPFQLAFVLMNLPSLVDPRHDDRETVDLLFFPTGGGKTEAYLGLAAFALVHRRLKNPGLASAGVSVLMRYTLRLLTLDQLGRASTLICALERERRKAPDQLGPWPFEIGLWVGRAATPNRLGSKRDYDPNTARNRWRDYRQGKTSSPPIPLEDCPWCGTKFKVESYVLVGSVDEPTDLRVQCLNRACEFQKLGHLPILSVDEPIYRRLPCFLIATVDKFAAMPWTGEVGTFFGRADRGDAQGFYGPCEPGKGRPLPAPLPPPDLIIQDELHLISGPMGTMVGLYETALDALASRREGKTVIRPKIVASTATVRRADQQIRALFDRKGVDVFPPPMPDRRDSFFAREQDAQGGPPRLYLGIAAQGRSPKVMLLRAYRALLSAAWRAYEEAGGAKAPDNPADPYLTLLGYFNSLRELGGSRRIVEDEVVHQVRNYGATRRRPGETGRPFADREITREVVELTSRVSTAKVAEAKRRLEQAFAGEDRVDVALATNMISVGLDIPRLGLMVVLGQPKTCAEYIQATSRVGRQASRPGLVVTLLNIHRPRDRSHYERFGMFHRSFYRSVEATSVTPFSPRALDRGLAPAIVALARLGHPAFTPPRGAEQILGSRQQLEHLADDLVRRAKAVRPDFTGEDADALRTRVNDLLDAWGTIADDYRQKGVSLQYQAEEGGPQPLLRDFLDPELAGLHPRHRMFRANRSMRDVEPSVNLWVKTFRGQAIEEEAS